MKFWMIAAMACSMALSVAAANDSPTDSLAAKRAQAALKPASQPANDEFPTPAELVKRMKKLEKAKAALAKVAYFNLNRPVAEKPSEFSLFGDDGRCSDRPERQSSDGYAFGDQS